jgi:hypothetical protein
MEEPLVKFGSKVDSSELKTAKPEAYITLYFSKARF